MNPTPGDLVPNSGHQLCNYCFNDSATERVWGAYIYSINRPTVLKFWWVLSRFIPIYNFNDLTPVVNFGDVRKVQLVKSILSPAVGAPAILSDRLRSVQMLKREWGAEKREATAPIQSLVKLQPCFLSLRWKTCLRQNCGLGFCACSEGPALEQKTLTMMMIILTILSSLWRELDFAVLRSSVSNSMRN